MKGLRARLADALRENDLGRYAVDIVDVLLSLPGIAIAELPQPDHSTPNTDQWHVFDHDVVRRNVTAVLWDGHAFDADESRTLAAALLAAANKAEETP